VVCVPEGLWKEVVCSCGAALSIRPSTGLDSHPCDDRHVTSPLWCFRSTVVPWIKLMRWTLLKDVNTSEEERSMAGTAEKNRLGSRLPNQTRKACGIMICAKRPRSLGGLGLICWLAWRRFGDVDARDKLLSTSFTDLSPPLFVLHYPHKSLTSPAVARQQRRRPVG
jgi:hypothetical protein